MDTPMSAASTIAGSRTPSALFASRAPTINGDFEDINEPRPTPDLENCAGSRPDEKEKGVDENIVEWDGPDDPECPRNWSSPKKVLMVFTTSGMILSVSFGSSVFAPAEKVAAAEFGVPLIVMQLTVALWILGFFAGPVFFGPLSEIFGHVVPFWLATAGMAVFQLPIALGENVRTILICRFFAGVFGSGVMAIVSGMYFELYEPISRGVALGLSAICINLGATIAPVAGAYLTYDASWRWTAWTTLIIAGALSFLGIFTVRETSSRMILRHKASRLRFETRNWALHSQSEETRIEFHDITHRYLTKPVRMFVTEPILIIITLYLTLVYGTLYLSFQAFPIAFQQRGWSATTSSLPFIAVILGILSAWTACSIFSLTWYKERSVHAKGPSMPEWRLPPMILGGILLPPSLFWFAWSGNVHWISQVLAMYFIGLNLMLIFISGIAYIVDVYQIHANSAMSIHIVVRSLISSSFPLFATIMYDNLGVDWASSILAFLCIIMVPAPILFYRYGRRIRSWSHFSFSTV
ncbi:MFS multidrug transporter [Hypoxylon rubiginosum]|uniref:MFS multidrug transporter n=1 Tax=Hypoxylon rubiginosum TaxID=110542 RepID=A0ACC0CVG7_9PEZI|nr:MFS multidrug transporter [Hypoxylon rubiginosum]